MLVADIGYLETSKRTGIKYATLRQWSKRYKWNAPAQVHFNGSKAVTNVTTRPADAHAIALQELKNATRMSLAKSSARLAKDAEGATLRDSGHVKEVAQTWAIVHEVGNDKGNTQILNVALLTGAEKPEDIVDVSCSVEQLNDK